MRYLIAVLISPGLEKILRSSYETSFGAPCKVRTIHLTLIPPFMLKTQDYRFKIQDFLAELPDFTTKFSFANPNIFSQHQRKILHLPIMPEEPIKNVYTTLRTTFSNDLKVDVQAFTNKKIPPFVPHITLDYNFKYDYRKMMRPQESFLLPKPELLIEKGPGIWISV